MIINEMGRDRPEAGQSKLVRRAVLALEGNPDVLASTLASYRRQHGLDERELAARFGLSPDQLLTLALCSRPDPTDPRFPARLDRLAEYVGCGITTLAVLLAETYAAAATLPGTDGTSAPTP